MEHEPASTENYPFNRSSVFVMPFDGMRHNIAIGTIRSVLYRTSSVVALLNVVREQFVMFVRKLLDQSTIRSEPLLPAKTFGVISRSRDDNSFQTIYRFPLMGWTHWATILREAAGCFDHFTIRAEGKPYSRFLDREPRCFVGLEAVSPRIGRKLARSYAQRVNAPMQGKVRPNSKETIREFLFWYQ